MKFTKGHQRNLFILCCAMIIASCTPDGQFTEPKLVPVNFPGTPDKLMANFVESYSGMDYDGYAATLHEDFTFWLQPCTVNKLDLANDHWDRTEELRIAANMFSRQAIRKDDGRITPVIDSIEFQCFEALGEWTPAEYHFVDQDVSQRTYYVGLTIATRDGGSFHIEGESIYFVTSRDIVTSDGCIRPYHQIIGWVDLTKGCAGGG